MKNENTPAESDVDDYLHYLRSCSNKVRYATEKSAKKRVGHEKKTGVKLVVYECKYCGGYHVGNKYIFPCPKCGEKSNIVGDKLVCTSCGYIKEISD